MVEGRLKNKLRGFRLHKYWRNSISNSSPFEIIIIIIIIINFFDNLIVRSGEI